MNKLFKMNDFLEIRTLFGIKKNNGFSKDELAILKRGHKEIPSILEKYYIQLGKVNKLNHGQDDLITPDRAKAFNHKEYLIFYTENQSVVVWGIRKEDLCLDNPRVYCSYDEKTWELEFENLTDFLNAMANLQALYALPFAKQDFSFISESEFKIVKQNFKKKKYSFSKWIGIDFYGNNDSDVIAVMKNNEIYNLFYSSRIEKRYKYINNLLNKLGK